MKTIKRILIKFYKVIYNIKFIFNTFIIRSKSNLMMKNELYLNEQDRVLIIAPHADDEWIGCSSIINRSRNVKIVYLNYTGSNNNYDNMIVRLNEIKKIVDYKKIDLEVIESDRIVSIRNIIDKYNPSIICVPNIIDWHDEHRESCWILKEVIRDKDMSNTKIVSYQVSVPIPDRLINNVVSLTFNELYTKWSIFYKIYESQRNLPIIRFICYEIIYGKYSNSFFSDVFWISDCKKWCEIIEDSLRIVEKSFDIKLKLNNIEESISYSNDFYKHVLLEKVINIRSME